MVEKRCFNNKIQVSDDGGYSFIWVTAFLCCKNSNRWSCKRNTGRGREWISNILVSQLINRKDLLVERLTNEIAESNNYWIKARDALYILVVEIVEKIFSKIEKQVINL